MLIGIPKEIKDQEYRIGATPAMVHALVSAGHRVVVQKDAGEKVGFDDLSFEHAGATIVSSAREVYLAEMVIKVKEPQASEIELLQEGQILFCYLHLAPDPEQTAGLIEKKVVAIAYETVTNARGQLPLLTPMSEIAGRIAVHAGANLLHMAHGGRGVLLGGVPGVAPANVVIIGGGVVGTQSLRMALGLNANVTVFDTNLDRLRELESAYAPALKTLYSTSRALEEALASADLVVGAVLIPGKKAPSLLTRAMLRNMPKGSVFVDVAIDQGGVAETSRPTTHTQPIYIEEGVVHYCVANMPGACARTATQALTNATLHYALTLANKGWKRALEEDVHLRAGLNVCLGHITNMHVAHDLHYPYVPTENFFDTALIG